MELFPDEAKGPAHEVANAGRDRDQQQGRTGMKRLDRQIKLDEVQFEDEVNVSLCPPAFNPTTGTGRTL